MKRILRIALVAIAASVLAAVSAAKDKAKPSTDEQTITQIENDWGTALMKADTAFIDRVESADFVFTGPDGQMATKAEGLAELKAKTYVLTSTTLDDLKVKIDGDTAIAFGLETEKSTYKGHDSSGQFRFTDVFVKRKGVWIAIATHSSKVEKH